MDRRSSMLDPTSPRESSSNIGTTPKGALDSISKRSFFKDMPTSTTNQKASRMDLSTPKGDLSGLPFGSNLHAKHNSVAQTPKVGGMGLDLSRMGNIEEADDQEEETARG